MIYQSNWTDRQLLNQAEVAMIKAGVSKVAYDNAVKTQGYLRLIQPIVTGQQIITFPVLQNQTGSGVATRSDEVRLPQQNAFFVGQAYFTIFKVTATTLPALYEVVPNTWPDPVTYTNAASYYGLYNGRLSILIDQSQVIRAYSMRKFLNIPETQLTTTGGVAGPANEFDGTAMLPWEPNLVFGGLSQIEINVTCPCSLGTIDADSFACWDFFGIEAQNVALGAIQ
jgi:hypothetical protein